MKKSRFVAYIAASLLLIFSFVLVFIARKSYCYKVPRTFHEAKPVIYKLAQNIHNYTLYCGCPINWKKTGKAGIPDLKICGYQIRKQSIRAKRIEAEHIMPAYEFGKRMACWKQGGRKACQKNTQYNKIASDLYNLWPAVGEVNGDRSNYPYGIVTRNYVRYGKCNMKISFKQHLAEPPGEVKGLVARTYLYMSEKYHIPLSSQQKILYHAWSKSYPASSWERTRNKILKKLYSTNSHTVVTPNKKLCKIK